MEDHKWGDQIAENNKKHWLNIMISINGSSKSAAETYQFYLNGFENFMLVLFQVLL